MLLRLLFRLSFGLRFCGLIVNVFRTRAFIPLKTCYGYLIVNCYSLSEISKFNTLKCISYLGQQFEVGNDK